MASCGLLLAGLGEVAHALHVADHAGQVVGVAAAAYGAFVQVALVDVSAVVAHRVGDVEREVVASLARRNAQELAVLRLAQVLLQVEVEGRAAGEVLDVAAAVEPELVEDVEPRILHGVEVAVVAVARHRVTVLAVPLGVFHAHVLRGDHLAVEHHLLRAVFSVVAFDQPQDLLHETLVVRIVVDPESERFGSLDQAVHADGQVLAREVDVSRVEERKHAPGVEVAQVLVVGQLHLVHQVHDLFEQLHVGGADASRMLDAAVEVDRKHAFRAGRYAARPQRVAEAVVLYLVAQAAAARQRVGVVAHVGEEGVPLCVHAGREVAPLAVDHVAVAREQRHGLYGEGQHGLRALGVEPPHEALLQPAQRLPVGARAVGEAEFAEQALEVGAVVVGDVPEDGLEVAGARRLVDRVDDLLEAVGHHLVECAAAAREIDHLVRTQVVVLAVLLLHEIVEIHEEFGRGAGAAQHARHDEDHIDEAAAERLEVGGCRGVAADGFRAAQQPRVHRDRGAVVGQRGLVVLVDEVAVEQLDVAVRELLAVHLLQPVGEQPAVQPDETRLGQLADQGGDVLVLDVGVGVVLRSGGRVLRVAVVEQEVELVAHLAVFEVALAVEHERFGRAVVLLGHERRLHLVLYLLHGHVAADADASEDGGHRLLVGIGAHRKEGFGYGVADLSDGEGLPLAVAFRDVQFSFHSISLHFVRWVGGGFGRVQGKGQAVPAADLPLFHPKAPDPRTTAGLLARSGLHAFPARGGASGSIVRLYWNLQLRG